MEPNTNAVGSIYVQHTSHKRWLTLLGEQGMLYLFAMTGYGKTTQVMAFAREHYKSWLYMSVVEEDFWARFDNVQETLGKPRVKTLLILDDLQWVNEEPRQRQLFNGLLRLRHIRGLHLFLISRAALPTYLAPLQMTRQLAVEDLTALELNPIGIRELLCASPIVGILSMARLDQFVRMCMQNAHGYPLGVSALIRRLEKSPDDPQTAMALATQDVYHFLSSHLMNEWPPARRETAIRLSVYDCFDCEMASKLLGHDAETVLQDFLAAGSFLQFKAPNNYFFVPFFREYLCDQLTRRPRSEWISLYECGATCNEQRRAYAQALRCWKAAGRNDKVAELVVYLSENADGCAFAQLAKDYLNELPEEFEQRDPRLLAARAMLAAYCMRPDECMASLERLREMSEAERKYVMKGDAQAAYARTLIACPYGTADRLKDHLLQYADYALQSGFHLKNVMPTGNMPSLINGGLDLLPWEKDKHILYPIMKSASELLMGREAVGIADASMGEILYEQDQRAQAVAKLTKALSAADIGGSIRVQYAVTAIMARLFQAEGQGDTAEEILHNLRQKVENERYIELLPNLSASLVHCALLRQNSAVYEDWVKKASPDEFATFYITMRFQLLTKAQVYTALGKTLEALHILELLEQYAEMYKRPYFHIEVLLLKAVILYRRKEEWQETLFFAVDMGLPYGLVRIYADQGAALLPLWKQADWSSRGEQPPASILREMKRMANYYPKYLKPPLIYGDLSAKEREVLRLMAGGANNTIIAQQLNVNLGTVKYHVANIMKKLHADNRTVAVRIAQEEGLLQQQD